MNFNKIFRNHWSWTKEQKIIFWWCFWIPKGLWPLALIIKQATMLRNLVLLLPMYLLQYTRSVRHDIWGYKQLCFCSSSCQVFFSVLKKAEQTGMSLLRCQAQLWTVGVVLAFKRVLLWDWPVWVSISVNIPLSWQLMLERTEQLLTEAQWAFLWQWSLSWTVSPLSAALLSPAPRTQHPPPPYTHSHTTPPPLHTSCTFHKKETL